MGWRSKVEENVGIWLLGSVAAGFAAGFGAYETILRVSNQVAIPQIRREQLEGAEKRVQDLESELARMKARVGGAPTGGRLILTSGVSSSGPVDTLDVAKLGSTVFLYLRWFGLTPQGFYELDLQLRDETGTIAHEHSHPFVPDTAVHNAWSSVTLDPTFFAEGEYRLRVSLNGEEQLDAGVTIVAADAG